MQPTLNTDKVVLRPITVTDAPALYAVHRDPETHRFWSGPAHTSEEETARNIATTLQREDVQVWAITTDGGIALGRTGLIHLREGVGEIGIILRRDLHGQGLASAALGLVMDYAFGGVGLHRLTADIDPDNAGSLSLFLRAGFKREGLLRGNWKTHIGIRDSVILGKLRDD
jgi:[ribosomal protein S5]-alanine N-acetyltransferase